MKVLGTIWCGAFVTGALLASTALAAPATLEQFTAFPFVTDLASPDHGDRIAWVGRERGVRNIYVASAPGFQPHQVTANSEDDGQELTNLSFSPDGNWIVWVRGGDHDANWPAEGNLQPDPASDTTQPQLTIWAARASGGAPIKVAEGDEPVISSSGRVAFVKDRQVWIADADGKTKPERLFFDRGKTTKLAWSPEGAKLAFVSRRGDHSFVGVYTTKDKPILWLAPSTGYDSNPVWSPDGRRIAFTRRPGEGGAPEPLFADLPQPWAIWTADATTGLGAPAWNSPKDLNGSYPEVPDGPDLMWGAGDRLVFRAEMDGWPHLYSVPASGGQALLLTPGNFMVEHAIPTQDGTAVLYSANTGNRPGDDDRRHVFRVPVDRAAPVALTSGEGLEWTPVSVGKDVAYIAATATRPPAVRFASGKADPALEARAAAYAPSLIVPRQVTFKAADGLTIHGQLFEAPGGAAKKPGVIFVHGGPPRQMLLGWSYMFYYSNAYAVNQYLAAHGFVVLSVNYRLGIGYGRAFQHPKDAGPGGASEYRDVLAGAKFLQSLPEVDDNRIGIWGGSYGGYLTAMALAKNSDIFKAGVDLHGVHDWSRTISEEYTRPKRYEQGDWDAALKTAFESSPVAYVKTWRSPVLLIQGDDDRNVRFNQTIDLARRLDAQGVPYEEMVIPNEIHDFLRHQDWLKADTANVRFLTETLKP